jgi:NhaA family Na+:H+ antiporter
MTPTTTGAPERRGIRPLRDFLHTEAAGGILLAATALTALIWANLPGTDSYESFWHHTISIAVDNHALKLDLRHWVNEAAMTIFFLVVGLEIKRELYDGHLSTRRTAAMPALAALGGMLVPAALYLAIAGGTAPRGWAVPMATDIALAVGILAVAGKSLAPSLRAFLLGLAIVDDIGAILVIAVVYAEGVSVTWLVVGAALVLLTLIAKRLGVRGTSAYVVIGSGVWFALHEAGVHATLAGVAMGLLAPTTPRIDPDMVDLDELGDLSDAEAARESSRLARESVSVVEWLQHVLHPWTSFVIVPVFALANAGVQIDRSTLTDAVGSPLVWGVIVGLVVGKPVGVMLFSRVAAATGVAEPPSDASGRHTWGVGAAAGIGFTVALFICELAFTDPAQQSEAKLAVLIASLIAAGAAAMLLRS